MKASPARANVNGGGGGGAASDDTRSTLHSRSLSKDSADGSASSASASSENHEDELPLRSSLDSAHPPASAAAATDLVLSFGATRFHAALDPSLTSNANALIAHNATASPADKKLPLPLLLAQNNSPSSNNNAQSAAALLGTSAAAGAHAAAVSACFANPFAADAMALGGATGHSAFDSAASNAAAYANVLSQLHLQSLPPTLPFPAALSSLQASPSSFLNFAYPYQQQSLK